MAIRKNVGFVEEIRLCGRVCPVWKSLGYTE